LANDAISHCGDSIEGIVVTAVAELKEPNCGNATKETNDMDKLRLSKNRPRSCLNMMKAEKQLS
jgi:hypothetical protein